MRLSLGCLEVSSGWCFDASHVAGVDSFKVAFDRGSRRWLMISCTRFGPMLLGSLQILGLYVGFSVVDVSMIDRGSPVLTPTYSAAEKTQAWLHFVASCCVSEGNQAGRFASIAVVFHFHRVDVQVDLPTSLPLICLLYTSPSPRD